MAIPEKRNGLESSNLEDQRFWMDKDEVFHWLTVDGKNLEELWIRADRIRRDAVGESVHLRGLLEISNHCVRDCHYCGLRAGNQGLRRYRMTEEEILNGAHKAKVLGYGTVVIQAGEDPALSGEWVARLVRCIKEETGLAITLSLGERSLEELAVWKGAGADRYLLRFETSSKELFQRIHPPRSGTSGSDRIILLKNLRQLGYEVGSGVMVGIPGQSIRDLANDLDLFRSLDLDMIGIGPFLPHPDTPLGGYQFHAGQEPMGPDSQAPNSESMTYRMLALARLSCPQANIPSTTALAVVNLAEGKELGLQRGANVFMPNLTPVEYQRLYEIYPAKVHPEEQMARSRKCPEECIRAIGRTVGTGPGPAPSMARRLLD